MTLTPRVVILVPRREGFADRDRIWEWCGAWWAERHPGWPIVEGHHDDGGPFNRSAALNLAARIAGDGWDVALIIDADVICDPAQVRQAVTQAYESGSMVLPYTIRHDLNEPGSRRVMEGEQGSWQRWVVKSYRDQVSSVLAVPRGLWEAVGGFDERFVGWGGEDNAFAIVCETFGGPVARIAGEVWELHHGASRAERHGSPTYNANFARKRRYDAAMGDREAIRALRDEPDDRAAVPDMTIPRILHRVVPERSPAQAEAWWAEFGRIHPEWRLLTHRDPLVPSEWPLTSPHWRKVANGAQLADLVRLEALWHWGGVYVDQDVQPVHSFEPLLPLQAFAAWEDERCVPNAILGARPGHPAIRQCLDLAIKTLRKGTWAAGPGVTTKVLPWRNDVLVLPPQAFYDVHYDDPDRDAKMAGPPLPWSFVRHHYWGSWLAPERQRVPMA